jgi:Tfp pilus assembly protein PilX
MTRIPQVVAGRRDRDDRGIALLVVIALMAIVGVLAIVMVSVAIHESSASGRDRQRSSAVMTAEGQVDALVASIQSAPPATLPCGVSTPSVSVGPDRMTLTNTVTYYDATGAVVTCPSLLLPTTVAASAAVRSTSTSNAIAGEAAAVRTVETLLNLRATYVNVLNMAIFGSTGISFANKIDLHGQAGQPDADVYTNGSVTCANNEHFYGSVFAQGSVAMSNTCVVEGDVQARTGFTATNPQVTVNGKVLVSNGSINLGPAVLGQQARASGSVAGNACGTTGKCFPAQTLDPPASQPFPQYLWNATTQAAYVADGYTVVELPTAGYPCGMYDTKSDYVAKWISDHPASTTKTVVHASCPAQPVSLRGVNLDLGANLAVFATGGFDLSGNTTIRSTTADHRHLYLVQPYDAVSTHPCSAVGISIGNQVSIEATVDDLLYTPCALTVANNTALYGQIYGGGIVNITNNLTMYYTPLPALGLAGPGQPVDHYAVDILYKRENNA